MRKIINGITLISAFILILALASCSNNGAAKLFKEENAQLFPISANLDKDEGMIIDGTRAEAQYQNPLSFTETNTGTVVTTYVHIGDKGAYFFVEVDDESVYISSEKEFFENDSVELYIDPNPEYSLTLDALHDRKVRNDCLHIRANCLGQYQTWYGRTMNYDPSGYPWVLGYFKAEVAGRIDGSINEKNAAKGYTIEAYIPWSEFGLNEKPKQIGVLPAFNNVHDREDTSRSWFSVKGMSHTLPTSYGQVDENGFMDVGYNTKPKKELSANKNDSFYNNSIEYKLEEVDVDNKYPNTRATIKAVLGDDALYMLAIVKDKIYTHGSDSIWGNDGIELMIDSEASYVDYLYRDSIHRIGIDVDGGVETDIMVPGYNDYVPYRQAVFNNIKVNQIEEEGDYSYKYEYIYEIAIPYKTLGLNSKPDFLSFAWAVQTPNEVAYILNRKDGNGIQEGQSWLWTDKHYPNNASEYYQIIGSESFNKHFGDEIADLSGYKSVSDVPYRYTINAVAKNNGLAIEMTQYVDSFTLLGSDGNKWNQKTHIEFEVWNGDFGYGWGGTYFAIFCDGDYYINNNNGVNELKVSVDIIDNGIDNDGYRYTIKYKMFIGFANNVNSSDGPYAYVKFYSYTPAEVEDYPDENITSRDGRVLYSDDCKSYEIKSNGIVKKMYT